MQQYFVYSRKQLIFLFQNCYNLNSIMQKTIDKQIIQAEALFLKQQNQSLIKQNQLLKKQLQQMKDRQNNTQKQLTVYKRIAFQNIKKDNKDQVQILQMQHSRIFQLQNQLQALKSKYNKVVKINSSSQQTQYALKCREYERKMKDKDMEYQKNISVLKQKLMKLSANEIVENKRLITTPNLEIKKSSLAVGKFV